MRAGTTGGESVIADAAGCVAGGGGVVVAPPLPPFVGPAVPPDVPVVISSAVLRARTSGVRMPSSSSRFLDADTQEELGILTPAVRARKMGEDAAIGADGGGASAPANGIGKPSGSAPGTTTPAPPAEAPASAMTGTPPVVPARMIGLDLGPACQQCGGMMQRTGSCYTCSSCGNNTGCG